MKTWHVVALVLVIAGAIYWMNRDRARRRRMIATITERLGAIAKIEEKSDEELKEILKSIS